MIYRGDEVFRSEFLALAEQVVDRNLIINHYWHLAVVTYKRRTDETDEIALKKLFYVLRPLMALDWLDNHPESVLPPMNLNVLREGISLPGDLNDSVGQLLELKKQTHEIGSGPIPTPVAVYIGNRLGRPNNSNNFKNADKHETERMLDQFHWRWINR